MTVEVVVEREAAAVILQPITQVSLKRDGVGRGLVRVTNQDKFCYEGELCVHVEDETTGGVFFNKSEIRKFAEALLEFAMQ